MKSKLPLKAVRSERPSGEAASAGKAKSYGERGGRMCGYMREVGDVCEWWAFMRGENYGWVFCEGGLCPECSP